MTLRDPKLFAADPQSPPFFEDQRVDLLAADTPLVSQGHFVVLELAAPRNQCLVIKGMAPYAMQRINVGAVDDEGESYQMIKPENGNGFFLFEPTIAGASAGGFNVNTNYNAARLAGAPLNQDRAQGRGISQISLQPFHDAATQWFNPLFSILVPENQVFRVVFSLLPVGIGASALPASGQYLIDEDAVKRVDFAGCVIVGQKISSQAYHGIIERAGRES